MSRQRAAQSAEASLRGRIAAYEWWAHTADRTAATAPGRRGLEARFEREVDPAGELDPAERARRVYAKRKAHFARLALVASLTGGKLRYALAELAALPRTAVVVEDRYSQVFKLARVRPALVADGLAELQVPLAQCPDRVLRDPPACRGMDLPVSGRRPRMVRHRGRRDRAAHTLGRRSRRDRTRRRAGPARAFHRRSPGLGARNRSCRPPPRQARARDLAAWRAAHRG
jgi:hypothetical protein